MFWREALGGVPVADVGQAIPVLHRGVSALGAAADARRPEAEELRQDLSGWPPRLRHATRIGRATTFEAS